MPSESQAEDVTEMTKLLVTIKYFLSKLTFSVNETANNSKSSCFKSPSEERRGCNAKNHLKIKDDKLALELSLKAILNMWLV